MGLLEKLEDMYYSFVDSLIEKGIPVDRIIEPIEDRGISSFYVFLALFVAVIGGGLILILYSFLVPSYTIYVYDPEGNPVPGAEVVLEVDGERLFLVTDEEGKISVTGNEVYVLSVSANGLSDGEVDMQDGTINIVLYPPPKETVIYVRDNRGVPLEATIRVLVDGKEVLKEDAKRLSLCFSKYDEKCISVKENSRITISVEKEGYTSFSTTYGVDEIPEKIRAVLEPEQNNADVLESIKEYEVTFVVKIEDFEKPMNGFLRVVPKGSPGSGYRVVISSGIGKRTLPEGTYEVVEAVYIEGGKNYPVEIKSGKTFTVTSETDVEITISPPEISIPVYVKVYSEDGLLLPDVEVKVEMKGQVFTGKTGKTGTAVIELPFEGCGIISLQKEGFVPKSLDFCTDVNVLEITMEKVVYKGELLLTLIDVRGEPVPGAKVYIVDENDVFTGIEGTSDSNGAVELSIPVGTYFAVVELASVVRKYGPFKIEKDSLLEKTLILSPGDANVLITFMESGLPVSGAKVEAFLNNRLIASEITSIDGTATLQLPAGVFVKFVITYNVGFTQVKYVTVKRVPVGVESYDLILETLERKDIERVIEGESVVKIKRVINENGTEVRSLERGQTFMVEVLVAYNGDRGEISETVLSETGSKLEVTEMRPPLDRNGDKYIINESGVVVFDGITFVHNVPPVFADTFVDISVSSGKASDKLSLPVGMELVCVEEFPLCFKLLTDDGLEPDYRLKFNKTYRFNLYILPKFSGSYELEVYIKDIQTEKETTLTSGTYVLEEGIITYIPITLSTPPSLVGIELKLKVLNKGKVLSDTVIQRFAVTPDRIGALQLNVSLNPGRDTFYPHEDIGASYITLYITLGLHVPIKEEYSYLPIPVEVMCDGAVVDTLTMNLGTDRSSDITLTPSCKRITISTADSSGYFDNSSISLEAVTKDSIILEPSTSEVELSVGEKKEVTFILKGNTNIPVNTSVEVVKGGDKCGVDVYTSGTSVYFGWTKNTSPLCTDTVTVKTTTTFEGFTVSEVYYDVLVNTGSIDSNTAEKCVVIEPSATFDENSGVVEISGVRVMNICKNTDLYISSLSAEITVYGGEGTTTVNMFEGSLSQPVLINDGEILPYFTRGISKHVSNIAPQEINEVGPLNGVYSLEVKVVLSGFIEGSNFNRESNWVGVNSVGSNVLLMKYCTSFSIIDNKGEQMSISTSKYGLCTLLSNVFTPPVYLYMEENREGGINAVLSYSTSSNGTHIFSKPEITSPDGNVPALSSFKAIIGDVTKTFSDTLTTVWDLAGNVTLTEDGCVLIATTDIPDPVKSVSVLLKSSDKEAYLALGQLLRRAYNPLNVDGNVSVDVYILTNGSWKFVGSALLTNCSSSFVRSSRYGSNVIWIDGYKFDGVALEHNVPDIDRDGKVTDREYWTYYKLFNDVNNMFLTIDQALRVLAGFYREEYCAGGSCEQPSSDVYVFRTQVLYDDNYATYLSTLREKFDISVETTGEGGYVCDFVLSPPQTEGKYATLNAKNCERIYIPPYSLLGYAVYNGKLYELIKTLLSGGSGIESKSLDVFISGNTVYFEVFSLSKLFHLNGLKYKFSSSDPADGYILSVPLSDSCSLYIYPEESNNIQIVLPDLTEYITLNDKFELRNGSLYLKESYLLCNAT